MSYVFDGPASIVEDKYNRTIAQVEAANSALNDYQQRLSNSVYAPPTISVQWNSLPAPAIPNVPEIPDLPDIALQVPDNMPTALATPDLGGDISDFDILPPALNFGTAPDLEIGTAPALPEVREVVIPDAPVVTLPEAPAFLALQTHTFGGVNLHEDWLDKLDEIPALTLIEPAPFQYQPGARYASELMDNLKATLRARLAGGTGLPTAVEQGLWDRARERETAAALARELEVTRAAEALGFPLPSGVMAGQLADARREFFDKVSGLSREQTINQAEREQANLQASIQAALALESSLLDDAYKHEMLAFESAKVAAENSIAAHNARIEYFKALLAGYQAYASAYETVIKAELNKVEVFRALLSAEQTKADINKSLVDRYKAEIDGTMAAVEIYKARVGAAQTLVELERTRIQAGAEQVKAFVATVNAQTAKADLYKTRVEAEGTKQAAYNSQVQGYAAKVGAEAERARVMVARYQALISSKQLEWDGWKARLTAATAVVETAMRQSSITMDGYRIGASAVEARSNALSRRFEAQIKEYEGAQNITFQVAKANTDAVIHANDARLEANKVGMSTMAQRMASAWAGVSASAQISGSGSLVQTIDS